MGDPSDEDPVVQVDSVVLRTGRTGVRVRIDLSTQSQIRLLFGGPKCLDRFVAELQREREAVWGPK